MNGKYVWTGVAVGIAVGIGWWVLNRDLKETAVVTPRENTMCEQDFLDAVLESPERMDAKILTPNEQQESQHKTVACSLPTGKKRHLLSDVKRSSSPLPKREPVAAESLYFWKDYASLRTDAIRNPDSAENRAGVVSLMKMRQRRLGQQGK